MRVYTKRAIFGIVILFVILTRFVGLDWGLPYPMHPDERNMASAIQSLTCNVASDELHVSSLKECLYPNFFAYGQLPLYIGFGIAKIYHLITQRGPIAPITFNEATLALRIISALSSLLTVYFLYQTIKKHLLIKKSLGHFESILVLMTLSLVPYAIQFAHFGTTESLLMFLYSALIYSSLEIIKPDLKKRYLLYIGLICGVAVGVKLSSLVFLGVPAICLLIGLFNVRKKGWKQVVKYIFVAKVLTIFTFMLGYFLSSPHNIISWSDFVGSIGYESAVALGTAEVFYTRQFFSSLPYYFQFIRVFPYALGIWGLLIFIIRFFMLPAGKAKWWIVRIAFVIPFLTSGFMFAKWSRFLAICYPVMSLIIAIGILRLYRFLAIKWKPRARTILNIVVLATILPGVAYMSIYINQDVRFVASKWIVDNVESNSSILLETANVVDIPLEPPTQTLNVAGKNYKTTSFDFYNVDTNSEIARDLQKQISNADYIFVPSRRVFANHTCLTPEGQSQIQEILRFFSFKSTRCGDLNKKYPILNAYYQSLFDPTKYQIIAKFTSYPRINLFGKSFIEFPDELAEETWTVFDHPVIRIYKKI